MEKVFKQGDKGLVFKIDKDVKMFITMLFINKMGEKKPKYPTVGKWQNKFYKFIEFNFLQLLHKCIFNSIEKMKP